MIALFRCNENTSDENRQKNVFVYFRLLWRFRQIECRRRKTFILHKTLCRQKSRPKPNLIFAVTLKIVHKLPSNTACSYTAINAEQCASKLYTSPDTVYIHTTMYCYERQHCDKNSGNSRKFQQKTQCLWQNAVICLKSVGTDRQSVCLAKMTLPIEYTHFHDCFLSGWHQTMSSCICSSAVASPSHSVC